MELNSKAAELFESLVESIDSMDEADANKLLETHKEKILGLRNPFMRKYCLDNRYSDEQLTLIREGLESGIDVTTYAHPDVSVDIMRQIKKSLSRVTPYTIWYMLENQLHSSVRTGTTKLMAIQHLHEATPNAVVLSVEEIL